MFMLVLVHARRRDQPAPLDTVRAWNTDRGRQSHLRGRCLIHFTATLARNLRPPRLTRRLTSVGKIQSPLKVSIVHAGWPVGATMASSCFSAKGASRCAGDSSGPLAAAFSNKSWPKNGISRAVFFASKAMTSASVLTGHDAH